MLTRKVVVGLIVLAIACSGAHSYIEENFYEERITYRDNPKCAPSKLDLGVKCHIGDSIEVQGGLYTNYELHYVPLASAYYEARLADALGYQSKCPTNLTFLRDLDIQTPWSGTHGAIALDGTCGYNDLIVRRCTCPNDDLLFELVLGSRLQSISVLLTSTFDDENNQFFCLPCIRPENPVIFLAVYFNRKSFVYISLIAFLSY